MLQAAEHLSAEMERPENIEILKKLAGRVMDLEARVAVLEGKGEETGYPAWKPWDGLSNDYQYGAIVSHGGKLWQSVYNGQNVWEPGTLGAETLWTEYQAQDNE